MSRQRKYTDDELISFAKQYIRSKKDFRHISASAIAAFCNDELRLYPRLTYHDFADRRPVVKAFIEKYNSRLAIDDTDEDTGIKVLPTTLLNVDKGAAAFKDEKAGKRYLQGVNKRLSMMIEANHRLSDRLTEVQKENRAIRDALDNVKATRDALEKDTTTIIRDQKQRNVALRKELESEKQKNRLLLSYVDRFIGEPVMLKQLSEMGLDVPHDDASVPELAEQLAGGNGLEKRVLDYFDGMKVQPGRQSDETITDGENLPVLTGNTPESETDKPDGGNVLSASEAEALDRLSKL